MHPTHDFTNPYDTVIGSMERCYNEYINRKPHEALGNFKSKEVFLKLGQFTRPPSNTDMTTFHRHGKKNYIDVIYEIEQ